MKLFLSIFAIFVGINVSTNVSANGLLTVNRNVPVSVSHECAFSVMEDENTLKYNITTPTVIDNHGGYAGVGLYWTLGEMPLSFLCEYKKGFSELRCSIYDNDTSEFYASGKMPWETNELSVYKEMSPTLRVRAMCTRLE